MDNQQLSITDKEIGWLAGIVDGEGCIGLHKRYGMTTQKVPKPRTDVRAGVSLANTSKPLIDEYKRILDKLGVGYYETYYPTRDGNVKPYWTIVVQGFKRVNTFLSALNNNLIAKQPQCALVLEFLTSRMAKWHRAEYSEREKEIPLLMTELNRRGIGDKSSTTIPSGSREQSSRSA